MSTSPGPLRVIVNGHILAQIERRILDTYRCEEEAWEEVIRQLLAKGLTGDQVNLVVGKLIMAGGLKRLLREEEPPTVGMEGVGV